MNTVIGMTQSCAMRVLRMPEELAQPHEHVPALPRSPEVIDISL